MSTAVRRSLWCSCGQRRCFSFSSGFLAAYLHNVHGPSICPSLLPLEYLQDTFVHVGGDSCHHPAVSHGEFSTAYQVHSHMFQHLTGFHDTYLYRHDYDSPMTRCLPSCLVEDWLLLANTSLSLFTLLVVSSHFPPSSYIRHPLGGCHLYCWVRLSDVALRSWLQ